MITCYLREAYKTLFRWSCLGAVLAALLINGCLLYTKSQNELLEDVSYKKMNMHLDSLEPEKRLEFIREYKRAVDHTEQEPLFTGDIGYEQILMRQFENRAAQIIHYSEYLRGIQEKADAQQISIFQNTSEFSRRNLRAAAQAFRKLEGNELYLINSDAFLNATEFPASDFIIIGILAYLIISMVIYEREHGLFRLLRSTKEGRGNLILAKMGVVLSCVLFLTVLIWGENIGVAILKYGDLDFSAPLQSVYGYDGSSLNMNIGQYLLLLIGTKMVSYLFTGLLILVVSMKARSTTGIYIGVLLLALFSALCYAADGNSSMQLFHYLNLVLFVQAVPVYRFYFNLNLFNYPVNIILLFWLGSGFGILFMIWINWKVFTGKGFQADIKRRQIRRFRKISKPEVRVFIHETYKLLISCKGILLFCFVLGIQGWMYMQKSVYLGTDEYYYKEYMQHMAGELNEEKEAFLTETQKDFAKYENMSKEAMEQYEKKEISQAEMFAVSQLISEKMKPRNAFERVKERADYARSSQLPMVYEGGYLELFGKGSRLYREDMLEAGLLVAAMILLYTQFCSDEYSSGMMKLISVQVNGRKKTLYSKLGAGLLAMSFLFIIVYLPRLLFVGKVYGYDGIAMPLNAIPEMENSIVSCPLWGYMLLLYLSRFFISVFTLLFIFAAAVNRKNTIKASAILLAVLVFPVGMHILGISALDFYSFNCLYSVNMVFNQNSIGILTGSVGIVLLGGTLAGYYLLRTMGRGDGKIKHVPPKSL